MTSENDAQDATTRFGFDLATLRATQRRFTLASYGIMAVAALGLAVWLGAVGEGDWFAGFITPFLIAVGAGLVAFILGVVLAQVLRQLRSSVPRLFTDTAAVALTGLLGLLAVSLFLDSWGDVTAALLGVVVATAAPMSIATSPLTAVIRDTPNAQRVVEELEPMPPWSNLLGGETRGILIGITADLVFRGASLVLLWHDARLMLVLVVVAIADAAISSRGVASSSRVMWLAPTVLSALGVLVAAIVIATTSAG
ncbi:MAG TPA: hypothetical protein PK781_10790 [Terrimesophilobacter sp.]|nr:hypothetical protein [Terrimesophilobacter sp.]